MLLRYLMQIRRGYCVWKRLQREYGAGGYPSRYIIFPDADDEYNAYGLYFIQHYISRNSLRNVVVVYREDDSDFAEAIHKLPAIGIKACTLSKQNVDALVKIASLVNMSQEWTIISVTNPYDTGAKRLLGVHGITKADIIWYDVYRMNKKTDDANRIDISVFEGCKNYTVFLHNLDDRLKNNSFISFNSKVDYDEEEFLG